MAEFASTGVANAGLATGIIGTALGVLNGGGNLLGLGMARNYMGGYGSYEGQVACQHDLAMDRELAKVQSELDKEKSERYADSVGLGIYKYFEGRINALNKENDAKWTDQAVINATVNTGMATMGNQVAAIQATVNSITKTAIPTSAICNFGCSGCQGTNNI